MKNKIIYIGNFDFPFGNAAGKRVLGNSEVLRLIGYDIVCIGVKRNASQTISETKFEYHGITACSVPYKTDIKRMRYKKYTVPVLSFIESEIGIEAVYAIILYGSLTNSFGANYIINWSKKHDIKIISDVVDWLKGTMSNPLVSLVKNADVSIMMRYVNKRTDGNIVISRYLQKFYARMDTLLLPPLTSQDSNTFINKEKDINERLHIIYAGNPFRKGRHKLPVKYFKDRLDIVINLICDAIECGCDLNLKIYGLEEKDFVKALDESETIEKYMRHKSHIIFYGVKSNAEVCDAIVNSDYSILIRDIKKATLAGFSTKISESISLGTPVITNECGDNSCYIKNGVTGFLLSNNYLLALEQFINIANMDTGDMILLKEKCGKAKYLKPEEYANNTREFLRKL